MSFESPSEKIQDILFSQGSEHNVAMVVDPQLWPELPDALLEHDPQWAMLAYNNTSVHANNESKFYNRVLPYLVELVHGSSFYEYWLNNYRPYSSLFMNCPHGNNGDNPFTHLLLLLHDLPYVIMPSGKYAWLRFYDPLVFNDLWVLATNEQQHRIVGDLVNLIWMEDAISGRVLKVERPLTSKADKIKLPYENLIITANQQEAFDYLYMVRFSFNLARIIFKEFYSPEEKPPPLLLDNVKASICLAENYGIVNHDDVQLFVKIDARTGWTLSEKKEATQILENTKYSPQVRLWKLKDMFMA